VVEKPKSTGVLTLMLPIMMVVFTLSYSAAFAIYIVVNSAMSLVINTVYMQLRKIAKERKLQKEAEKNKGSYSIAKYTVVPKTPEEIEEEKRKERQKELEREEKRLLKEQKKSEKQNKDLN